MSAPAPPRGPRPQMDARFRARRRAVVVEAVRRRRRVAASIATVLGIVAAAIALSYSPLFAVDEVRVTGVTGERADLVRRLAAVAPGERLLSVDLHGVRAEVVGLPWVREVDVSRLPPSSIVVAVTPRQPVAVVALPGASWLIDDQGVVVSGGTLPDLPSIDAPRSVLPGPGTEVSDAAVRNALAVHLALPGPLRVRVDRYDAPSDRGLRMHLAEEGIWVRMGLATRVPEKAQVVVLLLEQARQQADLLDQDTLGVAELDVRAPDNPVLIPGDPDHGPDEADGSAATAQDDPTEDG